ncbi:unnamed protein product [Cunninghamella blakesleeana]
MDLSIFPSEITQLILEYLPIKDLVRIERTSKLIQIFCLKEIERRMKNSMIKEEFDVMIHLGQVTAKPIKFDPMTKTIQYTLPMEPITIKTMYDNRRNIHCSLLRKKLSNDQLDYLQESNFTIPLEKGMIENKPIHISVDGKVCHIDACLTRTSMNQHQKLKEDDKNKPLSFAPVPSLYSLQVTSMRLPLSTIAA